MKINKDLLLILFLTSKGAQLLSWLKTNKLHTRIPSLFLFQRLNGNPDGIEAIFFSRNILEARRRKLTGGEASWILESNQEMVTAAEKLNGKRYKTYRIYTCEA